MSTSNWQAVRESHLDQQQRTVELTEIMIQHHTPRGMCFKVSPSLVYWCMKPLDHTGGHAMYTVNNDILKEWT